jgi:polyhydroxybutyrate depolymerase
MALWSVRAAGLVMVFITTVGACARVDSGAVPMTTSPELDAPVITVQPLGVSVAAPGAAAFSVTATGAAPLEYQWRRGGVDIVGATRSGYTTPATTLTDTDSVFSVRVSNSVGAVESAPALLTVTSSAAGELTSQTLRSSGIDRDFLLYQPANMPAGAVPLVVVLHGGSQDAAVTASDRLPTFAWRTIADREKLILVFPNGISGQWNDCRSDTTGRSTANDTAFISELIDRVSTQKAIDLSRVYVTGASNGGMMAFRIGFDLSERIAGVGANIANLPVDPLRECPLAPAKAMTIVMMNGTADPLMPYWGGAVAMSTTSGTVRGTAESRDFWVSTNGCETVPVVDNLLNIDPADGSTITRETYSGCRGSHRVVFFRIDGGGHTTPSLRYLTSGRQNKDLEGAEEIWRILREARRN